MQTLSDDDVKELRRLHVQESKSALELSDMFNCTLQNVYLILANTSRHDPNYQPPRKTRLSAGLVQLLAKKHNDIEELSEQLEVVTHKKWSRSWILDRLSQRVTPTELKSAAVELVELLKNPTIAKAGDYHVHASTTDELKEQQRALARFK